MINATLLNFLLFCQNPKIKGDPVQKTVFLPFFREGLPQKPSETFRMSEIIQIMSRIISIITLAENRSCSYICYNIHNNWAEKISCDRGPRIRHRLINVRHLRAVNLLHRKPNLFLAMNAVVINIF